MDAEKSLWQKAVEFHGHICPGLAIGFRTSMIARKLLGIAENQEDEQLVCIAETDACGVDAIQSILHVTLGTGSLRIDYKGKNVYTFYNRKSAKALRIAFLGYNNDDMPREEKTKILLGENSENLFSITETDTECPERVRIYRSCKCLKCNEPTAEHMITEKKLCPDCAEKE